MPIAPIPEETIDRLRMLMSTVPLHYSSQWVQLLQLCFSSDCPPGPVDPVTEQQWIKLLEAVQEAMIASVASPRMNRSDRRFSDATDRLIEYYTNLQRPNIGNGDIYRLMEAAKKKDALMQETSEKMDDPAPEKVTVAVRVPNATGVYMSLALSTRRKSSLWAILWMLMQPEDGGVHLTLQQNPYFYFATGEEQKPIPFHTELADLRKDQLNILVLVDREHRIFVETPGGRKVYGNIWRTDIGIILKDAKGELLTAAEVMDENQPLTVSSGPRGTTAKTWKEFVAAAVTNDTAEWRIKVLPISWHVEVLVHGQVIMKKTQFWWTQKKRNSGGLPQQKAQVKINNSRNYSLPDMPHHLSPANRISTLWTVLWMLVHNDRTSACVRLDQNPHFYSENPDLPMAQSPLPFDTKLGSITANGGVLKMHVVIDRKHQIFVQTPQGPMVYGNIWIRTSGQAVLKDVTGELLIAAEVMDENRYLVVSSQSQSSGGQVINVYTWKQFVMDAAGRDDTEWRASPLGRAVGLSDREILRLCEQYACTPIDALDQAIESQSTSSEKSREYLRALTKICGLAGTLPSSHILTEGLSKLADNPVAGGGFGEVWKGTYNNRLVAIKSLKVSHVDQPEALRKNFCKEVVLWKRLSHPNVVPLYGVSTEFSTLCMVSEWMSQGHIREYVRVNPEVSRLPLLLDVAKGLSHLHSSNLVHGDLKGDNILINDAGTARLCDFGLSSVIRTLTAPTTARGGRGSIRWMAPELFDLDDTGDGTALSTRASDIYAMSIVVVEVLTGELPFNKHRDETVMFKTITGCRPEKPANTSKLGISDELWEVVTKCWRKEPQERPEILSVLESFRKAAGGGAGIA